MQSAGFSGSRALSRAVVVILVVIAGFRAERAARSTPQATDEPCHIAAGMEWLDRHTYRLDPVHPPLARYAIALPLYLAGERYPNFQTANYTDVGNAVLYDGGQYRRNLLLARCGMLVFLGLATLLVFYWAKREFGVFAGCAAAFLFSTLPSVLAFSSIAYTDIPTACMQFATLLGFSVWLERPTPRHSMLLGAALGLALSVKLTSLLFLPSAAIVMLMVRWTAVRRKEHAPFPRMPLRILTVACIALVTLWGSYLFSLGHLQDALAGFPPVISFQHLPFPIRDIAAKLVVANPIIPAPDFFRGVAEARDLNRSAPASYLFGHMRSGGWWYFFPVALALKTPLPFLILALTGIWYSVRQAGRGSWSIAMPASAVFAILVATIFVSYKVGTRHVLVVLPLLSVLAGLGALLLWRRQGKNRRWARVLVGLLLAWQAIASAEAQNDFLAYFNELAPHDPSMVLVKGCDLDCGQDLLRLGDELRVRGATHLSLGVWSSADVKALGLPPVDVLQPYTPVTGWVAVSVRSLRTGEVVFWQDRRMMTDNSHPQDALSWLEHYRPVVHVGKTILLYQIPEAPSRAEGNLNNSLQHSATDIEKNRKLRASL